MVRHARGTGYFFKTNTLVLVRLWYILTVTRGGGAVVALGYTLGRNSTSARRSRCKKSACRTNTGSSFAVCDGKGYFSRWAHARQHLQRTQSEPLLLPRYLFWVCCRGRSVRSPLILLFFFMRRTRYIRLRLDISSFCLPRHLLLLVRTSVTVMHCHGVPGGRVLAFKLPIAEGGLPAYKFLPHPRANRGERCGTSICYERT